MTDRIDITYTPEPVTTEATTAPAAKPRLGSLAVPFLLQRFRIVVMVIAAVIVVRAVFLEPFGVPSGSMAPAIFGLHRTVNCRNCGFTVRVGEPQEGGDARFFDIDCPNCGARRLGLADAPLAPGDRLLVDKSAFDWRHPRRWEIAVFRCESEPDRPFIKRVAGLPNETISIVDGDVVVNGELARKSLSQCRTVAVPVCHMSDRPTQGWTEFWQPTGPLLTNRSPHVDGEELILPQADDQVWRGLAYRSRTGRPIGDDLRYNGRRDDIPVDWVHDFVVVCDLRIDSGDGELSISLTDGADRATLTLSPSRSGLLEAGNQRVEIGKRLRAETEYRLEFAFVDRRASARLDGSMLCDPIDLPIQSPRPGVAQPLEFRSRNLGATIRNVRIDRDLHYKLAGRLGAGQCRLGPSEYYMLGDNSGNSDDSRFWRRPGIPASALLGKPILIYAPNRWRRWTALGRTWDVQGIDQGRFGWIRD